MQVAPGLWGRAAWLSLGTLSYQVPRITVVLITADEVLGLNWPYDPPLTQAVWSSNYSIEGGSTPLGLDMDHWPWMPELRGIFLSLICEEILRNGSNIIRTSTKYMLLFKIWGV